MLLLRLENYLSSSFLQYSVFQRLTWTCSSYYQLIWVNSRVYEYRRLNELIKVLLVFLLEDSPFASYTCETLEYSLDAKYSPGPCWEAFCTQGRASSQLVLLFSGLSKIISDANATFIVSLPRLHIISFLCSKLLVAWRS